MLCKCYIFPCILCVICAKSIFCLACSAKFICFLAICAKSMYCLACSAKSIFSSAFCAKSTFPLHFVQNLHVVEKKSIFPCILYKIYRLPCMLCVIYVKSICYLACCAKSIFPCRLCGIYLHIPLHAVQNLYFPLRVVHNLYTYSLACCAKSTCSLTSCAKSLHVSDDIEEIGGHQPANPTGQWASNCSCPAQEIEQFNSRFVSMVYKAAY